MNMHNPAHPAEILNEEYIKPLGLTITEVAKRLGVTRKAVSELINMKTGISIPMAYRLAKACNTTPELWINMQVKYDLWQNRDIDVSNVSSLA
ncbi:HigA family addiction module antitoxin [Endozoicomonas lisbonensis]|uniref:Addiction module HigA family antidote n=1 Tax=Endozoicomonas lisbonensis TaxID=3120522 RepID=A0ABV2SP81_9GAMM